MAQLTLIITLPRYLVYGSHRQCFVTKEIISALCLQYTDLYNVTILQSSYLLKKKEKLFTLFEKINELRWKSYVELMCIVRNKEKIFNQFFPHNFFLKVAKACKENQSLNVLF